MDRRRFLAATAGAVLGAAAVGCSPSNPNEKGFETEGYIDPNIPVDAEEYEKKFSKEPPVGGKKKGKGVPNEI